MAGFNSISHGSGSTMTSRAASGRRLTPLAAQDFYPTFMKNQLGFGATQTTVITVVGQIGALIGGTTVGYISTFTGRRLSSMSNRPLQSQDCRQQQLN